jgi:polyribonucleotide nucleotidyltransferase
MQFTVTYSKNWDGGGQEYEAAKAAILAVVKNASVEPNRVDVYPITVTVEEKSLGVIYSGRQQGFFGKNGRPACKDVQDALRAKL